MTAHQTFSPARLFLGLVSVSIICGVIALLAWSSSGILHYVFLLALPAFGYGCVLYWSQMFSDWSVAQRLTIGVLFGFLLSVGFMFAVIWLWLLFHAA
jgi:hypothetical protein